jgi:hypothetical protein
MVPRDEFEPSAEQLVTRCAKAGLCADCKHSRRVKSDREAEFYLCGLHAGNPYFPKYPRLPVVYCAGHEVEKSID